MNERGVRRPHAASGVGKAGRRRRWEVGQKPRPVSLGLLPSGPDPVGEWKRPPPTSRSLSGPSARGPQWPDGEIEAREADCRPTLTMISTLRSKGWGEYPARRSRGLLKRLGAGHRRGGASRPLHRLRHLAHVRARALRQGPASSSRPITPGSKPGCTAGRAIRRGRTSCSSGRSAACSGPRSRPRARVRNGQASPLGSPSGCWRRARWMRCSRWRPTPRIAGVRCRCW